MFELKKHGTTVRTEIIAGLTTFAAMAYILMVNPGMFANLDGVSFDAVYIATALSAVIGTVLIGLLANLPLAQASGMGLNAFFVYTVCFGFGFTYANALVFVLVDGLIFILLTVTGLRKLIFDAIPAAVKTAIPAGIGLFIAFLGLQDAGIIVNDDATLVGISSFNLLGSATWESIMPRLVTIGAVIAIAILSMKKVKGAILWSILGGAAVYYLLGLTIPGFYTDFFVGKSLNPFAAFAAFGSESFGKVFTEGFDFSGYLAGEGHTVGSLVITFATTSLAFCMVDMFDTLGTLYGACRGGNLLVKDEKGEETVPNMDRAMLADAIYGHDLCRILRGRCRRRQDRSFRNGDRGDVLHRDVPVPDRVADSRMCLCRRPDLCRYSHDRLRQEHRVERSVLRAPRIPHDGDDAVCL